MLLKVMLGPFQPVILFHVIKSLVMSSNQHRQLIRFVICEHVLQMCLLHNC